MQAAIQVSVADTRRARDFRIVSPGFFHDERNGRAAVGQQPKLP